MNASDPFVTAFGNDDDVDVDDNDMIERNVDASLPIDETGGGQPQPSQPHRTKENGVLSFHNGTEQSLLLFVQQVVEKKLSSLEDPKEQNRRQIVLQAIDDFCFERHWMMHVGPDKGSILQDFIRDQIMQQDRQKLNHTYHIVELGTYCGYSTIRIADTLLQHHDRIPKFHIHTVDVNAQSQSVARQLIALAGIEPYVSLIVRESTSPSSSSHSENDRPRSSSLTQQLTDSIQRHDDNNNNNNRNAGMVQVDFLFVDHAKEMYLSDVQLLESCGLLRRGTAVAADNVVFFQLIDYCGYMAMLQSRGTVRTELVTHNVYLEYSPTTADHELRDGLELTVYLEDPVSSMRTTTTSPST